MKVLVTPWDGVVEGCGPVGDLRIWDLSLAEALPAAIRGAGMESISTVPQEGCLVVPAGSAVLSKALAHLAKAAAGAEGDVRFRWGGTLGAVLADLPGEAPDFGFLAPGGEPDASARLAAAPVLEIVPQERVFHAEIGAQSQEIALSDHLLLPVRHWSHLLWAALLGIGPRLWSRTLVAHPVRTSLGLAWAAVRSGSIDPLHLASALNARAKGVRIHRSAVVEGCILEEGARIGAGAVVRGAILGPGAVVEEQALCEGAVVGEGAVVQRQAMVRFSVLGSGSMVGGVVQLAVVCEEAQLKRGAYCMDQGFTGEVRVPVGEGFATVPFGMIGVCLGAGARVGSGVWIAPGRVVPPGAVLVSQDVVSRPGSG
jgi:carbonic anhydrase/acetyltransferase-like protein (isoleucine patch superfamily)